MRSSKRLMLLLANLALAAGVMLAAGCFTSPTSPNVLGTSTCGGSCDPGGGGGDLYPTPTPPTGGGGGTSGGSISGTVTGSTGGAITIAAANMTTPTASRTTNRTGDGAFTISGLADGDYQVYALEGGTSMTQMVDVTITGGNAVTGVALSF